ncbi:hypothetical protein B0H21DRAFT_727654 [Amylocystis lapponica]|nr:hypothetical protein B0H21DRAFT_727654 [Amylocystis lapponica]
MPSSYAPRLPPRLPFSPLIPGVDRSDSSSTLASGDSFLSSSSLSFVLVKACRLPIPDGHHNHNLNNPPLSPSATIPPKQIIQLLDLLERMDGDIAAEVQRVQHGIREAWTLIHDHKQGQETRNSRGEARRGREKRETKGVDDEFWLGV